MKSTEMRKKNLHRFSARYQDLCYLFNIFPKVSCKKNNIVTGEGEDVLNFAGDLQEESEWIPVIEAISTDKTLTGILLKHSNSPESRRRTTGTRTIYKACSREQIGHEIPDITESLPIYQLPVLQNHKKLEKFMTTISTCLVSCLQGTKKLTTLQLESMPVSNSFLSILKEGLQENSILNNLTINKCPIGNSGCRIICQALSSNNSISCFKLIECNITSVGAEYIAKLIKYQSNTRQSSVWKDTLRYQYPQLDTVGGLREIYLMDNDIGDEGVQCLTSALTDDNWIKVLKLENCKLSTIGAELFISLLRNNTCLEIVDLMRNPLIPNSSLQTIKQHLEMNSVDSTKKMTVACRCI